MANDPTSMAEFKKSGFYSSANIPALQEQLANNALSESEARTAATAQYKPTYDAQKTAFENQLAELGASRDRDVSKINTQYNKTLNGVMAGLNKQGMGRSSLVSTRGVETENARNAAISETSFNYLKQQNEINANMQQAEAAYAQNIETKATELKRERDAQQLQLQMQIAQLQQTGYSAYANYLNQKAAMVNQEAQLENEKLKLENEKYRLKLEKKKKR